LKERKSLIQVALKGGRHSTYENSQPTKKQKKARNISMNKKKAKKSERLVGGIQEKMVSGREWKKCFQQSIGVDQETGVEIRCKEAPPF